MKLPPLIHPEKYVGLYVFDFGDHVSVGYTGAEVTMLLQSEQHRSGQVYRIHRVQANGCIELQGVSGATFSRRDGMLFLRREAAAARVDFDHLLELGRQTPPPCHLQIELARLHEPEGFGVTAVLFPAESTHDVGRWLQSIGFAGGDAATGGVEEVDQYEASARDVLERRLLEASVATGRTLGEVMATTHLAVQR